MKFIIQRVLISMNKSDFKLIIFTVLYGLILIGGNAFTGDREASFAHVYYDNEIVEQIDLSVSGLREYVVEGYNGSVVIEADKGRIRVSEETSPLNICSKQDWVSSSREVIVCLPNKIVIKIISEESDLDAVVR